MYLSTSKISILNSNVQFLIINYNHHHHQQTISNFYFSFTKFRPPTPTNLYFYSTHHPLLLSISNPVQRTKFSNCFTRQLNKHGRVLASIILPCFVTVAWDKSVLVTVLHFEKLGRERIFLIPPFSRGRDVSTKKKRKEKKITSPVA